MNYQPYVVCRICDKKINIGHDYFNLYLCKACSINCRYCENIIPSRMFQCLYCGVHVCLRHHRISNKSSCTHVDRTNQPVKCDNCEVRTSYLISTIYGDLCYNCYGAYASKSVIYNSFYNKRYIEHVTTILIILKYVPRPLRYCILDLIYNSYM